MYNLPGMREDCACAILMMKMRRIGRRVSLESAIEMKLKQSLYHLMVVILLEL